MLKFEIPFGPRLILVCDSIDSMTLTRSYREALSFKKCVNEIYANRGIMSQTLIVDCVLDNVFEFAKIINSFKAKG